MPMKKAEMEAHRLEYQAVMRQAREAHENGLYRKAIELSLASWDHVDGMMQYERKYIDTEFATVQGMDMVLRYAPLLLDFQSLDKLEELLKACRRIEKNTSQSFTDKLHKARERMWNARRLWDHLAKNPNTRQDTLRRILGGDQDEWRATIELWEKMGLVQRSPESGSYRVALCTRMGELIPAKCPSCGELVEGPKGMLLEETRCPKCQATVYFVFLLFHNGTDGKG